MAAILLLAVLCCQPAMGQVGAAERAQLLKQRDQWNEWFQVLYRQGKFREALGAGNSVLTLERQALGEQHADTAGTYINLSNCLVNLGDYTTARTHLESAAAIQRRLLGEEHDQTAKSYNNLGVLLRIIGDNAASRAYHDRALAIRRKLLGEEHLDTAQSYNNLGSVLHDLGDLTAARAHYERSLSIKRRLLGEEHATTAASYNNLGVLLRELGDLAGARAVGERSLAIRRKVLGPQHADTAQSYHNLGIALALLGEHAAARSQYETALAIWSRQLGPEHPSVAESYICLGVLLKELGDTSGARSYYEGALEIHRKTLGERHANTAGSHNNLGVLLSDLREFAAARTHHERGVAIRREVLGETHPDTIASYNNLMVLETEVGDWLAATAWMQQERRATRQFLARVLPALSEREQLQFLDVTCRKHASAAMSLALRQRDNPEIVRQAAGWLLNGKGIAQEALTQRALLAREVRDPRLAPLVQQLLQVRTELSTLSLSDADPSESESRRKQLDELSAREAALARQLSQAGGSVTTSDPWIDTETVRKALRPGTRLVEIARFDRWSLGEKRVEPQGPHYLAFVIPPPGPVDVQMVDLGPAAAIETLLGQWRTMISTPDAEDDSDNLDRVSQQLADRLWKPLAPHLGDAKTLHLSPDGPLWLLPWGALPTGNDRLLIEDYTINCLVSGRDLATAPTTKTPTDSVLFADPDYDLSPQLAQEATQAVLRNAARTSAAATQSRSRLGSVGRLPGTAAEAAAVAPSLATLTGRAPTVYSERYALESVAKALRQPKVAIFATHGFFLTDQTPTSDKEVTSQHDATRDRLPLTQDGRAFENPLVRCGLLFAGCNPRNAGQPGSGDDGVLTGLEVVGIDFRGTSLVVLSACESGVGTVNTGEGVAGLRQAFQLAGAQSVLATLWQIPDRDSALIMKDFFANLAAGQAHAEALRNSQLKRIVERREKFGTAHPFYWAAWNLTGR